MIAAIARLKGALGDPERAGLRSDRPQTHLSVGFLRQRVIGRNSAAAAQEIPNFCHSGARAQPASPEPMNTDYEPTGIAGVHGFRARPRRASRNDGFW